MLMQLQANLLNNCIIKLSEGKYKYFKGGVVFVGGRKLKIFGTTFRHFEENMVKKRYFQH